MRKKILQESFSVLFNFGCRKILYIRGVCHDILPEFILPHSIRKLGRGTVLCFKTFCYRKNFGIRWVGEYHDFPSELFCGTVPKNVRRRILQCFISFRHRKTLCIRGVYHDFRGKIFVSKYQKHRMGTFLLSEIFLDKMVERSITIFHPEMFCRLVTKKLGILQCFINFKYRKTLCLRGVCQNFLSKYFCLALSKSFVG